MPRSQSRQQYTHAIYPSQVAALARSQQERRFGASKPPIAERGDRNHLAQEANLAIVLAHLHATATAARRFFAADRARSPALSDHQKCRTPSVPANTPGSNMHPKVAAFASLFPPFIRHAKTDPLRNAKTLRNSQAFRPSYPNLPT
jgi:hypothetical protein